MGHAVRHILRAAGPVGHIETGVADSASVGVSHIGHAVGDVLEGAK